jgi:regulator of sigma E protease
MPDYLISMFNLLLLLVGFGFVIFIHELGHFLAAKWVGIRVEQFAVGFGRAAVCWRKGIGLTMGTSAPRAAALVAEGRTDIGETEYRLNWIPLGGYVKMLGQDDTDASAESADPRSYNSKSVGARMLVISAGVIMNVILAAVGFTLLFLVGYNTPAGVVGSIAAGSPAQAAGVMVGDRIVTIDGKPITDFTKVPLAVALHDPAAPLPMTVERDGERKTLSLVPVAGEASAGGLLQIGIGPGTLLEGLAPRDARRFTFDPQLHTSELGLIRSGERIVAVNGQAVTPTDYAVLDAAVQAAGVTGSAVMLQVSAAEGGTERAVEVRPAFTMDFAARPIRLPDGRLRDVGANVAGLEMRAQIASVQPNSSARGKLLPGDVVTEVVVSSTETVISSPSMPRLRQVLGDVGRDGGRIRMKVLRGGTELDVGELVPNINLGQGRRGLGIGMAAESDRLVVGGIVPGSAADRAGLTDGWVISRVNDTQVTNWFDLRQALLAAGETATIYGTREDQPAVATLNVDETLRAQLQRMRFSHGLLLNEHIERRQTTNVLMAMWWGVTETRDSIQQFYITLKRMVQGTVSTSNMMGPLGIFHTGTLIADRGYDWLLWFLCIISANLAVVNFLPIPIMDGGHFVFLILEKIRGKPVSVGARVGAQVAGLVLLGGVFLLVTYQDIMRLF